MVLGTQGPSRALKGLIRPWALKKARLDRATSPFEQHPDCSGHIFSVALCERLIVYIHLAIKSLKNLCASHHLYAESNSATLHFVCTIPPKCSLRQKPFVLTSSYLCPVALPYKVTLVGKAGLCPFFATPLNDIECGTLNKAT